MIYAFTGECFKCKCRLRVMKIQVMYSVIINSTRGKVNWECELPWRHVCCFGWFSFFVSRHCIVIRESRYALQMTNLMPFYICRRIIMFTRTSFSRFLSRWTIICTSNWSTRSFVNFINFNGRTYKDFEVTFFFISPFFLMSLCTSTKMPRYIGRKIKNFKVPKYDHFNHKFNKFSSSYNRKIFRN